MSGSVFDGTKYLYAEQIAGKAVTLTIKSAVGGVPFVDGTGRTNQGIDLFFDKTPKALGVVGTTIRRQLVAACGTDDLDKLPGKRIRLITVPSKRAACGLAIRIDPNPVAGGAEQTNETKE